MGPAGEQKRRGKAKEDQDARGKGTAAGNTTFKAAVVMMRPACG